MTRAELMTTAPLARSRVAAGVGWALFAVVIWSGWFVVTRHAVAGHGTLAAADLVALRFGISGLILLPVLLRRASPLPRWAWREGLWFVAGSGAPFALVLSLGLRFAPASHAAALTPGTVPLFAAGFGALLLRERPGRLRAAGLLLIAAGAAAIVLADGGGDALPGHLAFLACGAAWGVSTVRLRRSGLSALDATALTCVISLLYVPAYLLSGVSRLAVAPVGELALQAVYQGVLASAVALLAFNRAVGLLGARAPGFTALVPVLATLGAAATLGEVPGPVEAAAVAAVAAGVLLNALGATRAGAGRG